MSGVIAFDPGLGGGVAWDEPFVSARPMPVSGEGLDEAFIAGIIWMKQPDLIVIERVGNILAVDENGERTLKNGASSMFTFGMGYGILRGLARAYQVGAPGSVQIDYPLPQQWKPIVLPGRTKGKQGAIDYCKEHFPDVPLVQSGCKKEHTGIADALCLLRYGQKLLEEMDKSCWRKRTDAT